MRGSMREKRYDMRSEEGSRLFKGEAATREEIINRFEESWARGETPAIEDYLPAEGSLRQGVLTELIHIDLEYRLKAGKNVRVEAYLQRFPELNQDSTAIVELILAEFRLRERKT